MIQFVIGAIIGFLTGAVAVAVAQVLIEDWQHRKE